MATATFRFVPIPPDLVIEPPIKRKDIYFDRPLAGGSVSATLKVTWTAKTPICIGDATSDAGRREGDPVLPIKIGGRYCLSGTTLRGMVRAVLEAATFSHLGRINEWRHHGFRDFAGLSPNHPITPVAWPNEAGDPMTSLRAGWLRYDHEKKYWAIRKVRNKDQLFVLLPIASILEALGSASGLDADDWRALTAAGKYAKLPVAMRMQKIPDIYQPQKKNRHGLPNVALRRGSQTAPPFQGGPYPNKNLVIVCGGRFVPEGDGGKIRQNECLFPLPGEEEIVIPNSWMEVFHRMHSDPGRLGGNPRGSWREWLRAYGWHEGAGLEGFVSDIENDKPVDQMRNNALGIPVFWKGDPADVASGKPPGRQSFWFSLSRVMRVPYAYSVGEVAQNLYSTGPYKVPRMRGLGSEQPEVNGWDFARAIFGEIDGANVGQGAATKGHEGSRSEAALRGRVSFGFAFVSDHQTPDLGLAQAGVFAQPRDSFWPFYLRDRNDAGCSRSYNSNQAIPAGRKRTLARRSPIPLSSGNENERTMTYVRFLQPKITFDGTIRVHNLHPVELGALLWAITFGDLDGHHWHQAGRAKGYGYGALAPTVDFARGPTLVGVEVDGDPKSPQTWIDEFRDYMKRKLGSPYESHPSVIALKDLADPQTSQSLGATVQVWPLEGGYAAYSPPSSSREGDATAPYALRERDSWRGS
jgi:CRISPR-associated protein (TIGR03986 family)